MHGAHDSPNSPLVFTDTYVFAQYVAEKAAKLVLIQKVTSMNLLNIIQAAGRSSAILATHIIGKTTMHSVNSAGNDRTKFHNGEWMPISFCSALLGILAVVVMTTPSLAVIQTYTDLASWQAAMADTTILEDFEGQLVDDFFGTGSTTSPNGQLQLSANANFNDNAIIDVSPFVSSGADINGNVVVNMRFLDGGAGANPQETVTVALPPGVRSFAFEYLNYDLAGDGTSLSFTGTNGDVVSAFDSQAGFVDPNNTTPFFFGVVDTDPSASITSFSFTGDPNVGTGFSSFNSFDDVRYDEPDLLTLRVNTVTGLTEIANDFATSWDIDSYRIESTTDDLNFSNWDSFSDQGFDAVDGPDANSIPGDGVGETWTEGGGSDDGVLAEAFLLGNSVFALGRTESLGNAFKVGGDPNSLTFEYRRASDGEVFEGYLEFVTTGPDADFDDSGQVDGLDFLTWQRNAPITNGSALNSNGDADGDGNVTGTDLTIWESLYGTPLSAIATAVPEPSGLLLLLSGIAFAGRRRFRL